MCRVALLVLFTSAALAAPVPKALKKKAANMEGDWSVVSIEANGKIGPRPTQDYNLWRVEGNTMTLIRENDATKEAIYPCDLSSEPKEGTVRTFEYKVRQNGYLRKGICELEGDTLRIAFSSDAKAPPTEMISSNSVSIMTFKRLETTK